MTTAAGWTTDVEEPAAEEPTAGRTTGGTNTDEEPAAEVPTAEVPTAEEPTAEVPTAGGTVAHAMCAFLGFGPTYNSYLFMFSISKRRVVTSISTFFHSQRDVYF